MSDLVSKCTICGALLDEEDLFCHNCGTEAPLRDLTVSAGTNASSGVLTTQITTSNFTCRGCGASMSYDASSQALRCPFCGSTELDHKPDAKEIAPEGVVPFVVEHDEAMAAMRQWLGQGFWRPGDLVEQAMIVRMTPVYVPYWVFQAETHTYWTADTNVLPAGSRGKWRPLCGEHQGVHTGLLVGASGALTAGETAALCPFDLSTAVAPEQVDLQNITFERFTVPRKYARPLARQGLEAYEAEECKKYVPGHCRNMKVNVRITNLASRPMLLPVWIVAYRYRGKLFRFLANGQTGRTTGIAPISLHKVAAVVAIVLLVLAILFVLLAGRRAFGHESRPNRFRGNVSTEPYHGRYSEPVTKSMTNFTPKCAAFMRPAGFCYIRGRNTTVPDTDFHHARTPCTSRRC